jgi:hypothetical protein
MKNASIQPKKIIVPLASPKYQVTYHPGKQYEMFESIIAINTK